MKTNFSQPQRQSIVGVLIMFFDSIQQYARALWPILVIWIFKFKEIDTWYFITIFFIFIIAIGLFAYLKYLNFTFFLDQENEEFIINEGVLNKTRTSIQLDKIQQVNIKQNFVQKIIGVFALDVDTAGSNKKEITIKAISHELAIELKARLLDNNYKNIIDTVNNIPTDDKEYPFVKISFISLVKVGITSNYIRSFLLLIAFFISTYENLKQFFGNETMNEHKIQTYFNKNLLLQIIPILIIGLFGVILIMNLVRIIFKYFDFKITKQNDSLLLSYGLLNTKATIIRPEKVQITSISSNYFQKKMNILVLKIKQATSGGIEEHKAAIDIPGCNTHERDAILKLLFHKIPEKGFMLRPNYRKLLFSMFVTIVLPIIAYLLFRTQFQQQFLADYFVVVYVIFVVLIQFYKFKNNRLFINDRFIIKQSGAWDINNEIIQASKIQAITTSQLFWHKKLNIGSLILHTAGGNIAFELGNYSKIKKYVNLWLYEIETSNANWM